MVKVLTHFLLLNTTRMKKFGDFDDILNGDWSKVELFYHGVGTPVMWDVVRKMHVCGVEFFFRQCVSVNCSCLHKWKVEMVFKEQLVYTKFCYCLQKSPAEVLEILQQVYGDRTMCRDKQFSKDNVTRVHLMLRKVGWLQLVAAHHRFHNWTSWLRILWFIY